MREVTESSPNRTKRFYHWNLELHLYSGMFISAFVLVFAVSTILFNHTWLPWRSSSDTVTQELTGITVDPQLDGIELAKDIMRQVGVSGEVEFFRYEPSATRISIPVVKPGKRTDISLNVVEGTAKVEQRRVAFWETLQYLHKSPGPHLAGFRGNWVFTRIWRWLADSTVYLLLFTSITGIYLWLVLKSERRWGLISLGLGALSFWSLILAIAL